MKVDTQIMYLLFPGVFQKVTLKRDYISKRKLKATI